MLDFVEFEAESQAGTGAVVSVFGNAAANSTAESIKIARMRKVPARASSPHRHALVIAGSFRRKIRVSLNMIDSIDVVCALDISEPAVTIAECSAVTNFLVERIELSPADYDMAVKLIENPPEPTEYFLAALRKYGMEKEE